MLALGSRSGVGETRLRGATVDLGIHRPPGGGVAMGGIPPFCTAHGPTAPPR